VWEHYLHYGAGIADAMEANGLRFGPPAMAGRHEMGSSWGEWDMISPRVTVIIIFRNEERFLPEALGSVLSQTYDAWELLLVDDGSTDGGGIMARERAASSGGRIRYLTHGDGANRGMSVSRNLGLANARGEYIAFLDADDVWLPGKLAEQTQLLDQTGAGLVYGRAQLWRSWEDGDGSRDWFEPLGIEPDRVVPPPVLAVQLIRNRHQTPVPSVTMLRRDLALRVGGFEAEFRGMFEDQVFFTKVLADTPAYVSAKCWAKYRQHADSCGAVWERTVPYAAGRLPFLHWAARYLQTRPDADPAIGAAVRQEIYALRHPWLNRQFARLRHLRGLPFRSDVLT
jgi:glycosyltransferase involved in cell wall biosynthesis